MKILDVVQGSPEWVDARLGIPTASEYERIVTPKKLEYASGAATYMDHLLAEYLCGYPIDLGGGSAWMERGTQIEPEARRWYEMHRGVRVEQVGFILRDDEQTGCSPDALVNDDGVVEIKCPALTTHIGYRRDPARLRADYRIQTQGELYITEREWVDLVSYHPDFPGTTIVERVEPEPAVQAALHDHLFRFIRELNEAKAQLAPHRMILEAA